MNHFERIEKKIHIHICTNFILKELIQQVDEQNSSFATVWTGCFAVDIM